VVSAGTARNVVPAEARAILDLRTTPAVPPAELVDRLDSAAASDLLVLSDRLAPRSTPEGSPLLAAARAARPTARLFGSSTLSDWAVLPAGVPALKVGPGRSERSHTPDEYVLAGEILDGARFYEAWIDELAAAIAATVPGSARAEGAA
jgi:acetylornithine deacetylase